MSNLTGHSLGRYHILEPLGEGGMATVYKAYDTHLETDVAVKVIRTDILPQNAVERTLKRFEREAKSLARLTHPNIVKVMDYGEYNGAPYLVLVYLPGGTLKELMKGKPMSWQEAVRLLIPIANALDYAHEQKIIHRDVKPANILLTVKGQPMLSDFGIAKILEMGDGQTLTGTGMGVGTPEYMAPEQGMGRDVDGRADIYSLGIIFYELITGRKPYTADTPMAVILKHTTDPLPRPRQYALNLPEAVERVLLKSLAKDPKDRYADAGAFAIAMENLIGDIQSQSIFSVQPTTGMDDSSETMDTFETNLQTASKTGTRQKMPAHPKKEIAIVTDLKNNGTPTIAGINSNPHLKTNRKPWVWIGVIAFCILGLVIVSLLGGKLSILPVVTTTPFTDNSTPIPVNKTIIPTERQEARITATAIIPTQTLSVPYQSIILGNLESLVIQKSLNEYNTSALSFSPDGNLIAMGFKDGTISIIDKNFQKLRDIKNATEPISSLTFSPDGKLLATGARANSPPTIWKVADGSLVGSFEDQFRSMGELTFSPDNATLAIGLSNDVIRFWNTRSLSASDSISGRLNSEHTVVTGIKYIDQDTIVTVSNQTYDNFCDLRISKTNGTLIKNNEYPIYILDIAISPDHKFLALGGMDGSLRFLRLPDLQTEIATSSSLYFTDMVYSPDGNFVAVVGYYKDSLGLYQYVIRMFRSIDGSLAHNINIDLEKPEYVPFRLAFSPDGTMLLLGSPMTPLYFFGIK